jgi:ATP-dependent helicase HrpB
MKPPRWSCRTPNSGALPIEEALPALRAALRERSGAILVAPPGAGKTTGVPLALLDEPWVGGGRLIMLEPRRLAARAAAARMAATLGEPVGATVGYRVRLDSRVSSATRLEIVTEGVFTRMILDDPGLEGVAGVLFDEFHERSLDADLGLAFAFDSQTHLRDDLRLLVMSATLDGARIAALLGDAPVIESRGRMFDVETRYLGKDPRGVLEDQVVRAIRSALERETGGVLVFLPGQGEILRVARRLEESLDDPSVDIAPLYGAMDAADQDVAIAPSPAGRRKVVLATAIAQTSLTLEGVRVVIDSGVARVPRWDPAGGITRLATVRASRAAVDQRRGRAGRTGPGVCWRLWDEAETRSLPAFDRPEILETDLTRLALDLARWGAGEGADLALLDRPPPAAMAEAQRVLTEIRALEPAGGLTAHGAAVARLPLPPRLAHMVLAGAAAGHAHRAALIGVLLTEQNLGGRDVDIAHRVDVLLKDRGQRARAAVALAARWARMAEGESGARASSPHLAELQKERAGWKPALRAEDGLLIARAWPERIAKARGAPGEYQLAGGRGVFLDPAEALAREPWLAVADLGGGASRDRILLAARLDPATLAAAMPGSLVAEDRLVETPSGALRGQKVLRLGALTVEEGPLTHAEPHLVEGALLAEVGRRGVTTLPWDEAANALRARVAFLRGADPRWPNLSDAALAERVDTWLAPVLKGRRSLRDIPSAVLREALLGLVPWELHRELDVRAPPRWTARTGSTFAIDYAAEGGPRVEVRVQELFGLTVHPTVGAGTPLALALLSPAHREIQVTRDLPGFWAGTWRDVRKDMRGRYPKHPWPEDPATAAPTTRAKPRPT